jgi:hypothetical protein
MRFAGGVLNLGLDPYRLLGKRVRNLVGESEAIFDADFLRFTREGKVARAGADILKALEQGEMIRVERPAKGQATFDIGFEESADLFQSGFIKLQKGKGKGEFSLVTREALPPEMRASIEGVGAKVEGIFVKETTGRKDVTPLGEIRDDTLRTLLPKTQRATLPIFPKIELSPSVGDYLQTFTNVPRAAKKPVRVADVVTYPVGDILRYAKALQSPDEIFRPSRSEIAKALGLPEKRTRLFNFEPKDTKQTKSSKTPLESIGAFDFDRGLQPFSKVIDNYVKQSLGIERPSSKGPSGGPIFGAGFSVRGYLGLGGGSSIYTTKVPLGIGGLTGAERRRRRDDTNSFFSEIEALVYPKESLRPLERLKSFTETRSNNAIGIRTDNIMKNMLDNLNKISTDLTPRLSTSTRTNLAQSPFTGIRTDAIVRTGLQTDQMMRQMTRQLTRQTTFNPTRTPPWRPTLPFPWPVPVGEQPKKKRKGKKRKVKYVDRAQRLTSPLSAVIGINTEIGREIQRFTERYT